MSGHLLSTINPAAAAEIQPIESGPPLPDVGDIVIYHMRQGHGRQGRTRFSALVQGRGERGSLNLTIIIDAQDFVDEQFVQPIGVGQEFHCWEWPDDSRRADGFRGTIAALHQRIGDLEGELAEMRKMILGDYDAPKLALFDIFAKMEARLKAVEGGQKGKGK